MSTPIKTYLPHELKQLMESFNQPAFRSQQLYEWLYRKHARSYDEMTNLSLMLREKLADEYPLCIPELVDRQVSRDGTRKYVLRLHDGCLVETVGIPSSASSERLTVCFSTQVGCAMQCAFCATGKEGFTRNLSVGEMVDQVFFVQDDFNQRVSNVVAMGQGEPFANYDALLAALRILNDGKGLAIGARHITVSTCGLIEGIKKFSNEKEQFTLAISLHAAQQETRDLLMPRVAHQPLSELKEALWDYIQRTNRRVTFEYLLMKDINDSKQDREALVSFCDDLLCHINLLPMNEVEGAFGKPSTRKTVETWMNYLEQHHIETTLRASRGSDIAGACGQLKNKVKCFT